MADELVKVQLKGPGGEIETVWAFPRGGDHYELDSTPWYAYGLSWHDIIEAHAPAPGEFPEFVRVVKKSGFRTIRLFLDPSPDASSDSQGILDRLRELGCSYEGMSRRLIAVDIPPPVDLMDIRQFLITAEVEWEHADPELNELDLDGPDA